jgi:hypothetical protein
MVVPVRRAKAIENQNLLASNEGRHSGSLADACQLFPKHFEKHVRTGWNAQNLVTLRDRRVRPTPAVER